MLVLEAGFACLAATTALCWPEAGSRGFAAVERWFAKFARKRAAAVLATGLAAALVRLAMLPLQPIPQPFIHDEFSYLLAADTFASGRLTNPTHPMWKHFESFHIIQQPTYMSMYFPAQGLFLAAGQALFRHPWYGVVLSIAIMCAAICWALQTWLPPGWALLGGALAVVRLGLFSNWVNGYYGGAVAATGGALLLGALPRMRRGSNSRDGITLAAGAILLAASRPYEGLLVCGPAAVALLWTYRGRFPVLARHLAVPSVLLASAAATLAYYDHRVFGNALTLPYQTNRAAYASAPVFLWQSPRPSPEYRHRVMHDFYAIWEMHDFRTARTVNGFIGKTIQKFATGVLFFLGFALLPPLLLVRRLFRDRRVRCLIFVGVVFAIGVSLNAWFFPHYAAPLTAAVYVLLIQCMRHLRQWHPAGQSTGLALLRNLAVACLLLAGIRAYAEPLRIAIPRWPSLWYGTEPLGLPRAQVQANLETFPGKHLAVVRYTPEHAPFDDWVYNAADIDTSKVVWAREMKAAENMELLRYFRDREAWLVEPDFNPPRVSPYPSEKAPNTE